MGLVGRRIKGEEHYLGGYPIPKIYKECPICGRKYLPQQEKCPTHKVKLITKKRHWWNRK